MNFKLLIDKCLNKGFTDVEVYSVSNKQESINLFNYEVNENKVSVSNVYSIRAIINNKCVSTYVENVSEEEYDKIAERLYTQSKYLENTDSTDLYEGDEEVDLSYNLENDFASYSKDKQIEFLKGIVKKAYDSSDLVSNVVAKITFSTVKKTILNNKGLNKSYTKSFGFIMIDAVVKKGEDTRGEYGYTFFKNVADIDVDKLLNDSVVTAISTLGAKSVETKTYKTVLSPECMITLLNAFSMHFSAESVIQKMSAFDSKLNTKVFGDNITLIDDPFKNEFNVTPFDDEGVKTYSKEIVSNGVLNTFMHNRTTAKVLNSKTTGNGFKPSIKSSVGVSPSNLYLKEGTKSLDEIFEEVGDGIYITGFDGAHAGINPVSGNFNLKSNGYLIENGKKSRPVTLIIVSGNFFDMMNDVACIGSDLYFEENIGSPSVFINKLNVSGK